MSDVRLKSFSPDNGGGSGALLGTPRALTSRLFCYANVGFLVACLDVIAILLASFVADDAYHLLAYQQHGTISLQAGAAGGILFVLIAKAFGLYRNGDLIANARPLSIVVWAWLVTLLLFASLLFLLKISDTFSRGAISLFGLAGFVTLIATRSTVGIALRSWLQDGVLAGLNTVVVGVGTELSEISTQTLLQTQGAREISRYTLEASDPHEDRRIAEDVVRFARENRVERILLALPWSDAARCRSISEQLSVGPWQVLLLPDRVARAILNKQSVGNAAPLVVELGRGPLSLAERALKRSFDIAVATSALVLAAPILVAVAIAIKIGSPGPVIFRQDRVGFNGRKFKIFKFRTMTVMENGPEIRQVLGKDDRVTWIGRWLRASSIDELPQLLNVLRGDMSLVGPRPHAVAHNNQYETEIATYAERHNVRPGITGWAQVHGLRGPTPQLELMERRVAYDLWYVTNWSFHLDLNIIARTIIEVFRARNAK